MSRVGLVFFFVALWGIPLVAAVFLILTVTGSDNPSLSAITGAAGVVGGALLCAWLAGLLRTSPPAGDPGGRWAGWLIVVAALAGTLHSSVPAWLNALINGAVLSYFVVFDIVLVRALRRDGSMRERAPSAVVAR